MNLGVSFGTHKPFKRTFKRECIVTDFSSMCLYPVTLDQVGVVLSLHHYNEVFYMYPTLCHFSFS